MKFKKNMKKGFTLVELIVVIAIVAILAAVSVISYLAFINQANESADVQLVKQLNVALQADETLNGKRPTMHEMLGAMEDNGFVVENLTKTKSGYDIVWDQTNNRFALTKADNTLVYGESTYDSNVTHTTWKFVDNGDEANTATNQNYSIYLTEEFAKSGVTNLDVKAGLDVGNYSKLENISYNTTSNESVVIRTNGGKLTVNAPEKTVKHYGEAQIITLTEVGTNSYYEHGSVNLIDIKKGRLVITNDAEADVGTIYLSATGGTYDDIIIATQTGSKLPDVVAREAVSYPAAGDKKLVVTIQTNVDANGENPTKTEKIYLYPESDVKEATNGYNVSDLGILVVEALSEGGIAEATEQITDAAVLESVKDSNVSTKEEVTAAATLFAGGKGTADKPYLISTAEHWNNFYQANYDSVSYPYFKLTNDIDFSGTTINNKIIDENGEEQAYFWLWGDLDGNGHSLINVSTFTGYNQLLPYIVDICVHDVTINYNIDGTRASTAATSYMCNTATFENVTITGKISTSADWASAFVAYPYGSKHTLTYKNCTNYANITTNFTGSSYAAPFGSHTMSIGSVILENCKNYGNISGGHASAFVGMTGGNSSRYTISNLENYGKLLYSCDDGAGLFTFGTHALNSSVTSGSTSAMEKLPSVDVNFNDDGKLVIRNANTAFDYKVTMSISVQMYGYNENNTWSGAFPRTLSKTYTGISGDYATDFVNAVVLENSGTRLNYSGEEQGYYGIYAPEGVENATVLVEDEYGAISLISYNGKLFYYFDQSNEDGTSYYALVTTSNGAESGNYSGTISVTLTVEQLLNGVTTGSGKVTYSFNVADAAALFTE